MINWPRTLVTEVARRRCVLFLGAGVAASAKNTLGVSPMGWKDLLLSATDLVPDALAKIEIKSLIDQNKLLLALQAISDEADRGDYQAFLDDCFNSGTFDPSELHEIIFNLDSRLVITTNFDKIYEKHCLTVSTEGFKVIPYYSDSLADEIRSDTRLIIKAHGSIDDVSKMVFTKAEYHEAKKSYSSFYSILKALLLTNTCIFIGCSMDDPDVLLLLEEIRMTTNPNRPHYALLRENSHSSFDKKDLLSTYNVKALEYGPGHSELIPALNELHAKVELIRSTS